MAVISSFIDKKKRRIDISADSYLIEAYSGDVKVGRFDFDSYDNDYESGTLLTNCDINQEFQRAGIGSEMIKIAEDNFGDFYIVNHLSEEGAAFLNFCKDKRVFTYFHKLVENDNF